MARNEKKTRRGVNPFDVVIVLLVLCLLSTFAYRVYKGVENNESSSGSEYVLTFSCEGKTESLADYLEGGTPVYLSANNELLGHIFEGKEAITVSELSETETEGEADNRSESETVPGASSPYKDAHILGKISLSDNVAVYNNGVYYSIGDVNFTVGSELVIYTEKTFFTIRVESISRIEQ